MLNLQKMKINKSAISFLLISLLSYAVNSNEVYLMQGSLPLAVPSNLSEKMGFSLIGEGGVELHSIMHALSGKGPEAWGKVCLQGAHSALGIHMSSPLPAGFENYIRAYDISMARSHPSEGPIRGGTNLLSVLKEQLIKEAFEDFKKAHLAMSEDVFAALVADTKREIKKTIIADKVDSIRNLNQFSEILSDNAFDRILFAGFYGNDILILVTNQWKKEDSSAVLIIKLSNNGINEIEKRSKDAAKF